MFKYTMHYFTGVIKKYIKIYMIEKIIERKNTYQRRLRIDLH